MATKINLEENKYYHIYNRGNNNQDIFFNNENYYYFLRLYAKYIDPFAETYAWCLMKNHFHLLIYVKPFEQINLADLSYTTTHRPKKIGITYQFSHLFNAYTQSINKVFNRSGSLFEKSFERKIVKSEKYFKNLIYYIHNNPVHHKFVENIAMYPWSSYGSVISNKHTKLKREKIIDLFKNEVDFINYHSLNHNLSDIQDLVIEHYK
jgi:putative transposase